MSWYAYDCRDDDGIEDDCVESFPNDEAEADDEEEVYLGATFTTLQALQFPGVV